MCQEKE